MINEPEFLTYFLNPTISFKPFYDLLAPASLCTRRTVNTPVHWVGGGGRLARLKSISSKPYPLPLPRTDPLPETLSNILPLNSQPVQAGVDGVAADYTRNEDPETKRPRTKRPKTSTQEREPSNKTLCRNFIATTYRPCFL
jgi:hypothetical protein